MAPIISNFVLWPELVYLNSGGGTATVQGSLEFQDSQKDVVSLTVTIRNSSGDVLETGTVPIEGSYGIENGVVMFEGQISTTTAGVYTVSVHVNDGRGLVSNELSAILRISPDPWVSKASMPVPQGQCSAVAANGLIYLFGGRSVEVPDELLSLVQIYDPASDTWTTGAPMPIAGTFPVAAVDGKIYLFGTSTTYVYDPALDSWSPKTSIALPRSPGVAAVNGRVYLMGGIDADQLYTSKVEIYDPATDTWSLGAPVPYAYPDMVATATGGKIYLRPGAYYYAGTWIYDPASDSWSAGFPLPPSYWPFGWVAVGNTIYGIGGDIDSSRVDAFDLSTSAWSSKTSPPVPLLRPVAVELNGKIYVFEVHFPPYSPLNLTFEYAPANDPH